MVQSMTDVLRNMTDIWRTNCPLKQWYLLEIVTEPASPLQWTIPLKTLWLTFELKNCGDFKSWKSVTEWLGSSQGFWWTSIRVAVNFLPEHSQGAKTDNSFWWVHVGSRGLAYLFKWAMGTVSEKGKQVWSVILGIQTDLLFMVALSLMMVSLEELVQILNGTR